MMVIICVAGLILCMLATLAWCSLVVAARADAAMEREFGSGR